MQLKSLRVRNFRTVGSEQTITVGGGATIVGPNNSGKTNLLRAVEMFFTGYENSSGYSRDRDLTFGAGSQRTSLVAVFDGDPQEDSSLYSILDELHALLNTERGDTTEFPVYLNFSSSGSPSYVLFPNVKKPQGGTPQATYSKRQKDLVKMLLETFEIHYLPSAKSITTLYDDLLTPFLRRVAASAVAPHINAITSELDTVADHLNEALDAVGLKNIRARFSLPDDSQEKLMSHFDFLLEDPESTSLFHKGQGIQSTALIAALLWIDQVERSNGVRPIWLFEEPESYLHPELLESCRALLDRLANQSVVVVTTHSLGFVPQDPRRIVGAQLTDKRTEIVTFDSYEAATRRLRSALGVKFSDFFNLSAYNLLVEGKTDRELINWALDMIAPDTSVGQEWPCLRHASILDFGGVRGLGGFLRASFEFIQRERVAVSLFDGDAAGVKERADLQQYFGQKDIAFQPNRHFISVRDRFAIEGLFPDEWIQD